MPPKNKKTSKKKGIFKLLNSTILTILIGAQKWEDETTPKKDIEDDTKQSNLIQIQS